MKFAYHNHYAEFHAIDGILPYDELLKHRSGKGQFRIGLRLGGCRRPDPVHYLKQYPARIVMLHVKDLKTTSRPQSN